MQAVSVPQGAVPPHDLAAEESVLTSIIFDDTGLSLDEARGILGGKEAFYADQNGLIFEAACAVRDGGGTLDLVTIARYLRDVGKLDRVGGASYIASIMEAPVRRAAVREHAVIVRDRWRMRKLIAICERFKAEAYIGRLPATGVQGLLEEVESHVADVTHITHGEHLRPLSDYLGVVHDNVLAALQSGKEISGISTGFRDLDKQTTGMHDGDLTIIAGRPGMGKTAYMLSEALNVAKQGYAVPFFSLEMPALQLALRLVSMQSRIELTLLRGGKIRGSDGDRYQEAMQLLKQLPLFIDDSVALTVFDFRARVKKLQLAVAAGKYPNVTQQRVGSAYADYLQLMRGRGESREREIASISQGMKETAKVLGIPITIGSQLNREVEKRQNKEPQLSDLRESGAIEQDADKVIFPHRPGYFDPDDPTKRGWADIILAKQRNGPPGRVRLAFVAEYAVFQNYAHGYEDYGDIAEDPAYDQ